MVLRWIWLRRRETSVDARRVRIVSGPTMADVASRTPFMMYSLKASNGSILRRFLP